MQHSPKQALKLLPLLAFLATAAFGAPESLPFSPATELPGLQIAANAIPGTDNSTQYLWFVGLAAFLVLLGVWSAAGRLVSPRTANNLFLNLRMQVDGRGEQQVYLRSLDLSHATFVSPIALTRGTRVRLNLGSLPDYPSEMWVDASVASLGQMGGESFLIKARLPALKAEQRQPLMQYLEALGGQSRLSHA